MKTGRIAEEEEEEEEEDDEEEEVLEFYESENFQPPLILTASRELHLKTASLLIDFS